MTNTALPRYVRRVAPRLPSKLKGYLDVELQNVMRGIAGSTATVLDPYALQPGEDGVVNQRYPVGDIRRYGAVVDGVTDDSDAINTALAFAGLTNGDVTMPPGSIAFSDTLLMQGTRTRLLGSGLGTQLHYTGADTAIDFDGYAGCACEDFVLYSTTGDVGIDVGPNNPETRYAHFWRLERVMIIGTTPDWSTTALGTTREGWDTAAFHVEKAFYGECEQCEASYAIGSGFLFVNQANGNTLLGCHARDCAVGWDVQGGLSTNGVCWYGGNIEASMDDSIGIRFGESDRCLFSGRMEVSAVDGIHVLIDPPNGDVAQDHQFIGALLTGTSDGYVLGGSNADGSDAVKGTFISGGRLGGSVTINDDCLWTRIECATNGATGIVVTDDGYGSIIHTGIGGGAWYERPTASNTTDEQHDLTVSAGTTTEDLADNAKTLSFTGQADFIQFYKLDASGTDLPIMRFGTYRVWVNPGDGKVYIKGSDPSTPTDGTVVGTQT